MYFILFMDDRIERFCQYLERPDYEHYQFLKDMETMRRPEPEKPPDYNYHLEKVNGVWKYVPFPEPPVPPKPFGDDPYSAHYEQIGRQKTADEVFKEHCELNRMIAQYIRCKVMWQERTNPDYRS